MRRQRDPQRRLFEQVHASEKMIPFCECHPDVIVKGGRDPRYGHQVFLSGGRSGLVRDCVSARGHPADAVMLPTWWARQAALFSRPPRLGVPAAPPPADSCQLLANSQQPTANSG